jgi:hypothetical protein
MSSIKGKSSNGASGTAAKNGSQHVVRENDGWIVKNGDSAPTIYPTQAKAISAAKAIAGKNSDVVVHNKAGKIHKVSNSATDAKMMKIWKSLYQETEKNGLPDA